MSSLFSRLAFTGSGRVTTGVLGVSLVAIGVAIYLTPSDSGKKTTADTPHRSPTPSATQQGTTAAPVLGSSTPRRRSATPTHSTTAPQPGKTSVDVVHPPPRTEVVVQQARAKRIHSTNTIVRTVSDHKLLTVHVPTKAQLLAPKKKYYGLAEDGLPGDTTLLKKLDTTAGKAPNLLEWFQFWDDSFPAAKVQQSWQAGALPVITWQSMPHDFANTATDISSYAMRSIARGHFDSYLKAWATSLAQTGLPVVIRLDQEMNGAWYPWGAGYQARGITNTPTRFRAAWQHIWQVFQSVGANKYAIWAWTPSRTDTLKVDSTSGPSKGDTGMVEDYPGDQYVDWMGMSAYQFRPSDPATYDFIFGGTLNGNSADIALKKVSNKPIFIAEWGSAQVVGTSTDNTANKVALTRAALANFLSDPRIIGFSLFNNDVTGVHQVHGDDGAMVKVETNWKFDSSPQALAAFRQGIAPAGYGAGLPPQPANVKVQVAKPH